MPYAAVMNPANAAIGMSDIEGKAAREAVSKCGQRASFKLCVLVFHIGAFEERNVTSAFCTSSKYSLFALLRFYALTIQPFNSPSDIPRC